MRQLTKQQAVEKAARLDAENFRLSLALHDIVNGDITWSGWHREQDGNNGKYRAGVSRYDSASGGLLTVVFHVPGQQDSVSVYDLDRHESELRTLRAHCASYQPILDAISDARFTWIDSHREPIASARIPGWQGGVTVSAVA